MHEVVAIDLGGTKLAAAVVDDAGTILARLKRPVDRHHTAAQIAAAAAEVVNAAYGMPEKVGAGSTMAVVFIAMSLVAETAARLAARGIKPVTFVSPNVPGVEPDHNQKVFEQFQARFFSRR